MVTFGVPRAPTAQCDGLGCTVTDVNSNSSCRLWRCIDCDGFVCDGCWDRIRAHGIGRTGRDGRPHEKVDPRVEKALCDVLRPKITEEELDRLQEDDEATTWFGIEAWYYHCVD